MKQEYVDEIIDIITDVMYKDKINKIKCCDEKVEIDLYNRNMIITFPSDSFMFYFQERFIIKNDISYKNRSYLVPDSKIKCDFTVETIFHRYPIRTMEKYFNSILIIDKEYKKYFKHITIPNLRLDIANYDNNCIFSFKDKDVPVSEIREFVDKSGL